MENVKAGKRERVTATRRAQAHLTSETNQHKKTTTETTKKRDNERSRQKTKGTESRESDEHRETREQSPEPKTRTKRSRHAETSKRGKTAESSESPKPTKKTPTEGPPNFYTYIVKISKDVNDDVGVRKNVREFLDELVRNLIKKFVTLAQDGLKDRTTIQERDIERGVKEFLPENEVREMLLNESASVMKTFEDTKKFDLLMSVPRVKKNMMEFADEGIKISKRANVYLATVLEQVIIEVTKAANEFSKKNNRNNITRPDLEKAVKNDAELKDLLTRAEVSFDHNGEGEEKANSEDDHEEEESPEPRRTKNKGKQPKRRLVKHEENSDDEEDD